jgi:toxin-antitoxin system PIN domain toxin
MIGVDTQLIVYASRQDSPWYERANPLLAELAMGRSPWAIPWPCVHEYLNIVTHPRRYNPPSTPRQAFDTLEDICQSASLVFIGEGPGHLERLRGLITAAQVIGPRVHDARIAAICIENGVRELWSADRDFSAFPGLKTRNPLVPAV